MRRSPPWISFEAYPISVQTMGGTLVRVPLTADHAFDLDAVAAAVTERTKLVLLATPNNPTGTAVSSAAVARLAEDIPGDVVLLVDEAYREFADGALGDPVAELLPRFDNVAVARTFSKAFGLASLRVGYVMAHPEIVSAIDKCLIPFNVNGLAPGRRAGRPQRRGCGRGPSQHRRHQRPSGPGWPPPWPPTAGTFPTRRPTSCGCTSATEPTRCASRWSSAAWWSDRSRAWESG